MTNLVWRENHPETVVVTKPGLQTWWHQFRLGWPCYRVVTFYDVLLLHGITPIDLAREYDHALALRRARK